jgi:cytochrome c
MKLLSVLMVLILCATPVVPDDHNPTGDAFAGASAFKKQCTSCHMVVNEAGEKLAGRNSKSGPNLYNIAGASAGTIEGYRYGKSLASAGAENGLVWTNETFTAYVQDPQGFLRKFLDDKRARAKMSFRVRKEEDAINIYAYLYTLSVAE